AVDINQERLDFAVKQGIADVGVNPLNGDAGDQIRAMTGGMGADRTIEANGFKATYDMAIDAVRPGGNVSFIGVFEKPQELAMNTLWIKNINISNSLFDCKVQPLLININSDNF
ncbi:MAG TPA: zinc-binding dehydrogenase, partial [Syntrophomonadaceae bacterium]|nr:zinc-binding dehydrogenase [Syntrophomonadaceae bacterium]